MFSKKAIEAFRKVLRLGPAAAKLMAKVRKGKDGRLYFHDPISGEQRELTDEEKVEVSRIIVAMTIAIYAAKYHEMDDRQKAEVKKRAEAKIQSKEGMNDMIEMIESAAKSFAEST